jgi:hypothetical protein
MYEKTASRMPVTPSYSGTEAQRTKQSVYTNLGSK